ncbi:uncharacterized protein LOC134749358 [Cydia strobilella]|uniref:uncharacterized protein LOC134749358 n=1 Tax=Cydia strobilella TaxID=1100964 RepID=UPI003007C521
MSHQPGRGRRKKRAREPKYVRLRYASWNIGTMTGKGRELADVMKGRRINVAFLQETKWKGARAREIGEGYKFYYCGSDGRRNGVGIVLDRHLKQNVTNVDRKSDRIIAMKVMLENVTLNLISVYAPQSGCDDVAKEKFWEDFDAVTMTIPANEEIYVGGDFNGHVGRMNVGYERVHGGFGFGTRNTQGEALLQAATALDMAIANTWFQKRDEHLITYKSGNHATQIDYFLVKRNKINCIKDSKIIPGEHLTSQHRLLVIDVNIKIQFCIRTERPPAKIRWHMLEKNECAIKFKERVIDKMIEMNGMEGLNANECWNEMANYIRRVAKDVLGESKGKGVIDKETWWWNEEVQGVLKKKKQAFKEWQSVETGQEVEKEIKRTEYIECKKKAKRAVAIARTAAQDNLYESLNSPKGEKQLYRLAKARERSSRDMAHIKCVKDDAGKVITKDEAIKERWKVYFERLMNEENEWGRVLEHRLINMGAVKEICMDEVRTAVRSMKNGKSVGPDDIPGEVWKLLREDGCRRLLTSGRLGRLKGAQPDNPALQRLWDDTLCERSYAQLLAQAARVEDAARLKAVRQPESRACLQALPSPHLGTLLDNDTLRVGVALRLGSKVCEPHRCICGVMVEANGHHVCGAVPETPCDQ